MSLYSCEGRSLKQYSLSSRTITFRIINQKPDLTPTLTLNLIWTFTVILKKFIEPGKKNVLTTQNLLAVLAKSETNFHTKTVTYEHTQTEKHTQDLYRCFSVAVSKFRNSHISDFLNWNFETLQLPFFVHRTGVFLCVVKKQRVYLPRKQPVPTWPPPSQSTLFTAQGPKYLCFSKY